MKKIKDFFRNITFIEFTLFVCILTIVALLIVVAVGYVNNEMNAIDTGIIIEKDYDEGHYSYANKTLIWIPDSWAFTIRGEKEGEQVEYWFEVDENIYNKYEVGQVYP